MYEYIFGGATTISTVWLSVSGEVDDFTKNEKNNLYICIYIKSRVNNSSSAEAQMFPLVLMKPSLKKVSISFTQHDSG